MKKNDTAWVIYDDTPDGHFIIFKGKVLSANNLAFVAPTKQYKNIIDNDYVIVPRSRLVKNKKDINKKIRNILLNRIGHNTKEIRVIQSANRMLTKELETHVS